MLKVISDNSNAALIKRFSAAQVGLTPEENDFILSNTPQDQFILASAKYEMMAMQDLDINADAFPSLKQYMQGPFAMHIYNRGNDLESSLLCFDVEPLNKATTETSEGGIITKDTQDITVRSLAVIPFVDVFKAQIEREAEMAERFIRKSKDAFKHAAAKKDRQTVDVLMSAFHAHLNKDKQSNAADKIFGKESVSDSLASSLIASTIFYDQLWGSMQKAFEPALRNLGEDYALGKISLDTPSL